MSPLESIAKLWPLIMTSVALIVLVVKLVLQMKQVVTDLETVKPAVAKLSSVPERIEKLEKRIERMTPRVAEVRRLRMDFDALDDDVNELRHAQIRGIAPGPRARRYRTPASGVPVAIPVDETDSEENGK